MNNFILETFKKASLCRHFENQVFKQVSTGLIKFPVYLSAGQEYIPASISEICRRKKITPFLFGQHRGHSLYLSFNGNIDKLIKELLGKKDGCTYGMGGSLSIHSEKIKMFGHDGFMGSNACIATGACFSTKKPTIVFIGDAALEEDYVLASLSWVAKKKLPIVFVVEDNNFAVLTKKKDRRDWKAVDVAKSFKMLAFDIKDDPVQIYKSLKNIIFKKPILINIHTNRIYWHAGAGIDNSKTFDRHKILLKRLGKKGMIIDKLINEKVVKLWKTNLEIL